MSADGPAEPTVIGKRNVDIGKRRKGGTLTAKPKDAAEWAKPTLRKKPWLIGVQARPPRRLRSIKQGFRRLRDADFAAVSGLLSANFHGEGIQTAARRLKEGDPGHLEVHDG